MWDISFRLDFEGTFTRCFDCRSRTDDTRGKQGNMSDVMLLTLLGQLWSLCQPHYHSVLGIHQAGDLIMLIVPSNDGHFVFSNTGTL